MSFLLNLFKQQNIKVVRILIRIQMKQQWAVFHGQRSQYVLNHLNVTKSLMKDIKSRKLKYFGHVKRHQNSLKSVLEGVIEGRRCLRTSAQCLVWQHKGVDRKECDCMQCGSPEQNRMEVHSRQPSDWRRHLIGIGNNYFIPSIGWKKTKDDFCCGGDWWSL